MFSGFRSFLTSDEEEIESLKPLSMSPGTGSYGTAGRAPTYSYGTAPTLGVKPLNPKSVPNPKTQPVFTHFVTSEDTFFALSLKYGISVRPFLIRSASCCHSLTRVWTQPT